MRTNEKPYLLYIPYGYGIRVNSMYKWAQISSVSSFLTICEQRPLWKTQLVAMLRLTGVKSFCVPK